jgi:flagellar basal body-associated protein FliL
MDNIIIVLGGIITILIIGGAVFTFLEFKKMHESGASGREKRDELKPEDREIKDEF